MKRMSPRLYFYERNDNMKIIADTKSVTILEKEKITSGAYNDVAIEVELSEEYNGLTSFVTFGNIKTPVIGNMVMLPTLKHGSCRIGVYAIEIENNELKLRYSPTPDYITVSKGTYSKDCENDPPIPSPSEGEKIFNLIDKAIEQGKLKGDKGETGDKGDSGKNGIDGANATINGMNCIEIEQGNCINIQQDESVLTINADLSNYYTKSDIDSSFASVDSLNEKQNRFSVGTGLQLNNGVLELDIPFATDSTEYGGV